MINKPNPAINQLTDPIKDALLFMPRETLRAGKDIALGAPRKAFKTITGIMINVARLPLIALLNIPILPTRKK